MNTLTKLTVSHAMATHASGSGNEAATKCISPKLRAGKGRGKGKAMRASDDVDTSSSDDDTSSSDDDTSSPSSTASSCVGEGALLKGTRRQRQSDSDWSAYQDDDFSDASSDF